MKEHLIKCAVLLGLIVFIILGAVSSTIVGFILCGLAAASFYLMIHVFVLAILEGEEK